MSVTDSIENHKFPDLYQSADQVSVSAQRRYLRLQKCHISCLILGSIGATLATIVAGEAVTWIYIALAIVLVTGANLTWVSRVRRDNKTWFDCRAIAESTKTVTWRFMMKAAPFKDDSIARVSFIDQLQRIRGERHFSSQDLAQSLDASSQSISDFMDNVRQKPLNERQNLYLVSRLRDQKNWYSNKAKFNSKVESYWFWIVLAFQMLAIAWAILQASSGGLPANMVPLLMTFAATAIAWSQTKRYGELAQTYSLAAQELGDQEAIASDITEETDFLTLVEQVEETISREHTMWCARRDVIISPTDKES